MKLINLHPTISDETIREIFRHVRCPGTERVTVAIREARSGSRWGGSAWVYQRRLAAKVWRSMKPTFYVPYDYGQFKGRRYWVANCVELLVCIMAHEARHFWQRKVPKGWRVWGARGRYSEIDAEAYTIRKLREWRRRN